MLDFNVDGSPFLAAAQLDVLCLSAIALTIQCRHLLAYLQTRLQIPIESLKKGESISNRLKIKRLEGLKITNSQMIYFTSLSH
ncbi:hypothetical protein SynMEDNS5_02183 [Synechococcus sp. MEDNS5]|uniref:hypothetical protein n=1 Tax=Synechococcus sp. MEDNS5 TaxID=1442554 RepID=UPI001643FFA3|nr:hypothetical protein [Synechococcus sp. MEDNS5]QNJ06886.1 hypothetical protein SynMEDNS5_02183 [Synechococcus sp. MEDNS5]